MSELRGPARWARLGAALLAVLFTAVWYYWSEVHSIQAVRHSWEARLSAMAYDREVTIERWLSERVADARTFSLYPTTVSLLRGDPTAGESTPFPADIGAAVHLQTLLRNAAATYGYSAAWVTDARGGIAASADPARPLPAEAVALVDSALKTGAPVIRMLLRDPPQLLVVVPVLSGQGAAMLGATVLQMDPERTLYPILATEPLPTRTGEVVLAQPADSGVVFLSPLRKRGGSVLTRGDTGTAAFDATLGATGFKTARDYTGAAVWAVTTRIDGTDFVLVAKVDAAEALAPAFREARAEALVVLSLLLAVGSIAYLISRRHSTSVALRAARERTRFAAVLDHANDPILFIDEAGSIVEANDRAGEFYGVGKAGLAGRPAGDLRLPATRSSYLAELAELVGTGSSVVESIHVRAGGTAVPVEVSSRVVEEGETGRLIVSIIRDLSDRRAAEARIGFLNRMLRTLSGINSAITRDTNRTSLLHRAVAVPVDLGDFLAAGVVLLDDGAPGTVVTRNLDEAAFRGVCDSDRTTPLHAALRLGELATTSCVEGEPNALCSRIVIQGSPGAFAAAPILLDGAIAGCIALFDSTPDFFGPEVSTILAEVAADLGFALQVLAERERAERERAAADRALRQSESQFRWIAENAPDVIYRYRLDGDRGFEYVNPVAEKLTGYTPDEYYADPDLGLKLIHPEDREKLLSFVQSDRATNQLALRWVRRDGTVVAMEQHIVRVAAADGRPAVLLGVARDVTDAERSQRRLLDAHERLALALQVSRQAVIEIDLERQELVLSAHSSEVLGLGPDVCLLSAAEWLERVHPADRQAIQNLLSREWPGNDYEASFRMIVPPFTRTLLLVGRVVERDDSGQAARILGIAADITERLRAQQALRDTEEKYRAIVENTPDVIARLDLECRYLYVSPSISRYVPFQPEQMVGRTHAEIGFPPELCTLWDDGLRQVIADGAARELEYSVPGAEGPRYFEWRMFPEYDKDGMIHAVVSIAHEITTRRHLQEQLRHAQKLEALGRLAGGIAHDFNNILTAIRGYASVVCDDVGADHALRPDLDEIVTAADRAAALTRQLLAFSRRQLLNPRLLDLGLTVGAMQRMVQRLIGEHIVVQFDIADQPMTVLADEGQIEQVLLNLCVNARDAMPDGGTLTVGLRPVPPGADATSALPAGPRVMLSVSDTGVGMTPDVLGRLFEPFFTTKELGRGTGLGLSTVYGIVKQSGGDLQVTSQVGQGSVFHVYLPLQEAQPAVAAGVAAPGVSAAGTALRILLAEDEESVRTLTQRILERRGHHVTAASSGPNALELLERSGATFDVLITDMVMPGMGGAELARRVLARQELAVLFMTGYTEEFADSGTSIGREVPLLQKPFSSADLLRSLESLVLGDDSGVSG